MAKPGKPKTACYSTAVLQRREVTPFDQFEYDYRTSIIRNPNAKWYLK